MEEPAKAKRCNCARCGKEIFGDSCRKWWEEMPARLKARMDCVAGRIADRPYCSTCYALLRKD